MMELFALFILVVSFLWGSQPQFTFLHEMDQFLQDICEVDDE